MAAERRPRCSECPRSHYCIVETVGRDYVTVSCGRCENQVYFTFKDGDLVDSGLV